MFVNRSMNIKIPTGICTCRHVGYFGPLGEEATTRAWRRIPQNLPNNIYIYIKREIYSHII